jgi:CBS-domain-containing membrane protein
MPRPGDRVREREMTGAKSIPQLKVRLKAFFQNASRHSHLRLSVRQQFGLAIMPTVVVLLVVACLQALRNQPLIFTSLASSAFLVYLDPKHPTNRVRTFLIAQGSAALLGLGSVSLLGTGFLAPGVALVLLVVGIRTDIPSHRYRRSGCPFVVLRHIIQANFGKIKSNVLC